MSPPTEQLIRDYLNRLSVAARGRLGTEDRQALVARTRDFIERNASRSGAATSMQVAALLARLGDPGGLVDQEVVRLAAVRGEPAAAPADRPGRLAGRLLRRNAASWHWPVTPGSADLRSQLLNGSTVPPAAVGEEQAGSPSAPPVWVPRQPGPAEGGRAASEAAPPPGSAATTEVAGPAGETEPGPAGEIDVAGPAGSARPAPAADGGPADGGAGSARPAPAEDGGAGSPPLGSLAWGQRLAGRALARSRRNPVEAVAVILLGLGGVIYPPVWLLGAAVGLASRAWDYRDKWVGLGGPVFLLVVGTTAGVALGSSQAQLGGYVHEAWIYLNILSRIGAVAGTWYLTWRLGHPRRVPDVPPWNKPYRVD